MSTWTFESGQRIRKRDFERRGGGGGGGGPG